MARYFQEKGGESNSLFGLIFFWNTCESSNPRGGKNALPLQAAQQRERKPELSPIKRGRHKPRTCAPPYKFIICLNLDRNKASSGQRRGRKWNKLNVPIFSKRLDLNLARVMDRQTNGWSDEWVTE